MTTPEEQPKVGDFLARLEFKYDNDVLDFLKTGKGVVVVEDKIANIPLPKGAKGDKGDIGQLREGDVRYFNRRTDEAEAAAEASEASAGRSKASEEAAKASETNAKSSETNAKSSETKAKASETKAKTSETNAKASEEAAKTSETNAKTSETNAKASEEGSTSQAELSTEAAAIASLSAIAFDQLVGEGPPEGKVEAPVGAIYTDRLATNGAIRWIKTSGTGNRGWEVEWGDTGWRDVTPLFAPGLADTNTGQVFLRRTAENLYIRFRSVRLPSGGGLFTMASLPSGWRPTDRTLTSSVTRQNNATASQVITVDASGSVWWVAESIITGAGQTTTARPEDDIRGIASAPAGSWPTTMPGTPD